MKNHTKKDLYQRMVDFIGINQRFPSINGESDEEKILADDYSKVNLTGEEKSKLNKLHKKYLYNTVLYEQKRKGK